MSKNLHHRVADSGRATGRCNIRRAPPRHKVNLAATERRQQPEICVAFCVPRPQEYRSTERGAHIPERAFSSPLACLDADFWRHARELLPSAAASCRAAHHLAGEQALFGSGCSRPRATLPTCCGRSCPPSAGSTVIPTWSSVVTWL